MRYLTTAIGAPLATLVTSTVMAHDGHGRLPDQGHSPAHYVTEPIHLLPLAMGAILVMAVVYGMISLSRARLRRSPVDRQRR